jgi:hypothetical protein
MPLVQTCHSEPALAVRNLLFPLSCHSESALAVRNLLFPLSCHSEPALAVRNLLFPLSCHSESALAVRNLLFPLSCHSESALAVRNLLFPLVIPRTQATRNAPCSNLSFRIGFSREESAFPFVLSFRVGFSREESAFPVGHSEDPSDEESALLLVNFRPSNTQLGTRSRPKEARQCPC